MKKINLMSFITVIIPNYNHAPYLKERIESILNQTCQDIEIIILDDASTDNSKTIIEQYRDHPKVKEIIYNTRNSGSTFRQWKKGIDCAKGEYIWIAESDDSADPGFLEAIINCFEKNDDTGLVFTQSFRYNSKGEITGNWSFHTSGMNDHLWQNNFTMNGPDFIKSYMFYKNAIPNASAVVFKKSVYERAGGLNTDFKINGDWFLYTRILAISGIGFISEPLSYFREHDNQGSSKNIREGNNVKEYYDLIRYWKKQFKLNKSEIDPMLESAFNIWSYNNSFNKMLRTKFLNILLSAFRIDKKILARIFRFWKHSLKTADKK